ncbi:hypothetical protein UFOVP1307_140 [uncultured Caudovirales phage]|uniref:Uncharacterized protein n=1 Tax=uncultured Caudovirales phage TaxID=2100421 RepID=A0A6J5PHN9_9CAUD|nr:hypothetical protein UFOVP651_206 [uncultured Caudovirales phage]CAB4170597.1 hypothetical protein UFOVP902_62 [uncultured Caudovirales phage]CAB4198539.1 hypothetical protein UFOVP1307_140 [uncultured Caudovirales phage]
MKLLLLFLLTCVSITAQTVIQYDNMETWNWAGNWWTPAATATWATNTSVSATESAVIYGLGNAASIIEQDWYSLPNITGLNPANTYQIKFKLASQTFTSTATTRGVDIADYINVQISRNGGVSYVTELRITGNTNAIWPYTSTGAITHTANGTFTNSAGPAGDVYQAPAGSTTTGPSTITVTMPIGITQLAVDIYCRINSAGEEWWIDNIQLLEINPLPIELIEFAGTADNTHNLLTWKTATELNNDYYIIERSIDGTLWRVIDKQSGAGTTSSASTYSHRDKTYISTATNYYRLTQVDFNGNQYTYDPIAVDNKHTNLTISHITNLLGQQVNPDAVGYLLIHYDNGLVQKVYR